MLRAGTVSATELTRIALDGLDGAGRALAAVVTIAGERALTEAGRLDEELARGLDRGPLHGIPYGLKDVISAAGLPTTWGAEPFRDQVLDTDATVTRRLREAGAVLVAKVATVELAGGMGYDNPDASLTGPSANPWDPKTLTGGSSSGPWPWWPPDWCPSRSERTRAAPSCSPPRGPGRLACVPPTAGSADTAR